VYGRMPSLYAILRPGFRGVILPILLSGLKFPLFT